MNNVKNGAVTMLRMLHKYMCVPPTVCGKQESKWFSDHSENIVFERVNIHKYGLKQNILLDKHVTHVGIFVK